jgi:predicted DNA-binding protein YlxM (UPF0122 family)
MKLLRKKAMEIRLMKPEVNPQDAVNRKLMEKINKLNETLVGQETLRQKGYLELRRENEVVREELAKLKIDRDTVFDVLKRPVTLFFNSDL